MIRARGHAEANVSVRFDQTNDPSIFFLPSSPSSFNSRMGQIPKCIVGMEIKSPGEKPSISSQRTKKVEPPHVTDTGEFPHTPFFRNYIYIYCLSKIHCAFLLCLL